MKTAIIEKIKSGVSLRDIAPEYHTSDVVLVAVSRDGLELRHAPKFNRDIEIIEKAISQTYHAFQYIFEDLKTNIMTIIRLHQITPRILSYVSDYNTLINLILDTTTCIPNINPHLRTDRKFIEAIYHELSRRCRMGDEWNRKRFHDYLPAFHLNPSIRWRNKCKAIYSTLCGESSLWRDDIKLLLKLLPIYGCGYIASDFAFPLQDREIVMSACIGADVRHIEPAILKIAKQSDYNDISIFTDLYRNIDAGLKNSYEIAMTAISYNLLALPYFPRDIVCDRTFIYLIWRTARSELDIITDYYAQCGINLRYDPRLLRFAVKSDPEIVTWFEPCEAVLEQFYAFERSSMRLGDIWFNFCARNIIE